MKLAIWTDLHIGKKMYRTDENNYNKFEQSGYKALQEYTDIFIKEKPDLIINAGDIFDTSNPSILAMTKYYEIQNKLKDIPTMTILGNHDFSFINRDNQCSAAEMANHTYFADYDIKTVEIDDILFVMMPYIYDTSDNIKAYIDKCIEIATNSTNKQKILVTHGITKAYSDKSFIKDPLTLPDNLIELFDLVIIGHIHTTFNYKQKNTLVLSPGALIDYQAYEDKTGPIFIDTDNIHKFRRVNVKTPHIIKAKCNKDNINKILLQATQTEDIFHITYEGDVDIIDNDLFIQAKNNAINITIDIIDTETNEDTNTDTTNSNLNFMSWVNQNYPDYIENFEKAKIEGGI